MPYWAERVGTPRTLAVENPFGHVLGRPGEPEMQRQILLEALQSLETMTSAGMIMHAKERWTGSVEDAIQLWQPTEPSPIIAELTPQFRQMLRNRRKERD